MKTPAQVIDILDSDTPERVSDQELDVAIDKLFAAAIALEQFEHFTERYTMTTESLSSMLKELRGERADRRADREAPKRPDLAMSIKTHLFQDGRVVFTPIHGGQWTAPASADTATLRTLLEDIYETAEAVEG